MDRFDTDLIECMRTWAPFGAPPPEDAFPKFGLTSDLLWLRFHEITTRAPQKFRQFSSETKDLLDKAPNTQLLPTPENQPAHNSQATSSTSPDVLDSTQGQWSLYNGVRV